MLIRACIASLTSPIKSTTPWTFLEFAPLSMDSTNGYLTLMLRYLDDFCLIYKPPISSQHFPNVCESCQLGKIHRLPFTHKHVSSLQPFELMYSSVWGPSPHFSIMIVPNLYRYSFCPINLKFLIPLFSFEP